MQSGLYLPGLHGAEIPEIAIAIDTSGSVDNEALSQFASELSDILASYPMNITVIYCDSDIQGVDHFGRDDLPIELAPCGFGGTDFRPPFEWIENEMPIQQKALVYFTDLECDRFPEEPDYPVLWLVYGESVYREKYYSEKAPFGETIQLDK